MKRSIIGLVLLSGISACLTEGALPELPAPSASEALPSSLQIRVSDPDRPFDEAWEVTGQTQWVELEVEVRGAVPGQTESLLADETIAAQSRQDLRGEVRHDLRKFRIEVRVELGSVHEGPPVQASRRAVTIGAHRR